ncbi:MAG: acyl-CoA/acyl-ACP dehydrogenase [Gammaproteobacteria bacterium]|nr:acyl-CoA/acyl-ACP dehydrogenase [Gammaproteobacteria bacterium]
MRFALNDEQTMFQDAIHGALQQEASNDKVRAWTEAEDLSPFNEFVSGYGLMGLGFAEELGGQGGGAIELAILFEELGRTAAPSGAILAGNCAALGFAAQLPDGLTHFTQVLAGEASLALCSHAGRLANKANTISANGDSLSGSVELVLNAPEAEQLLVPVADHNSIALWLVDSSAHGVTIKPRKLIDRTRHYGDVSFERVTATQLGVISQAQAASAMARLALAIAAETLGLCKKMLDMTVDYAKQREQFGVKIGSFQAVKHACAEMVVDIEAAYSGIYYTAWAIDNNEADADLHAWIVKAFCADMGIQIAESALKLHGAIGYTWEYDLHYFYKRAKSNLELFGSPKQYREKIAQQLPLV